MSRKAIYDEIEILADIHRFRGLTIEQIAMVYFPGPKYRNYVYKKLRSMKGKGLIDAIPHVMKGRKMAKTYFATQKGIDRLNELGRNLEVLQSARHNKPDLNKLDYLIKTNNIYASLKPYGIRMIDSREWKKKHSIDRNTLVRGGLVFPNGEEYAVYAFFNASEEFSEETDDKDRSKEVGNMLLKRLRTEISEKPQSNKFICLIYDAHTYNHVSNALAGSDMVYEEFCVIPVGSDEFGYDILRSYRGKHIRAKQLEELLPGSWTVRSESPLLKTKFSHFAKYIAKNNENGAEYYVVDYLQMDEVAIHSLCNLYHQEAYRKDGRSVLVLHWNAAHKQLDERLPKYSYIQRVPFTRAHAEDWIAQIGNEEDVEKIIFTL